jgi:predicted dithiol-disulfide oxidoreductase (DUF899 family)
MKNDGIQVVQDHPVVPHEEWLVAREAFLHKGKGNSLGYATN